MNLRKFLIMALLLAAGGFYVVLAERGAPQPDSQDQARPLLPDIKAEEVAQIRATHRAGSFWIERNTPTSPWMMRRPEGAEADETKARELLSALFGLRTQNTVEQNEVETAQGIYGLSPPELVVTVKGTFGERVLSFGKKVELSGRRYVQPEKDGRLFLVDDTASRKLELTSDDIRDRTPFAFDPETIVELAASRAPDDVLRFFRTKEGWKLESNKGTIDADEHLLRAKLKELRNIKVVRFIDEPGDALPLYGLGRPKLLLALKSGVEGEDLGAKKPDVIAQVGEGVTVVMKESDPAQPDSLPATAQKGYYLKLTGTPFVYELERPFYSNFLQPPEFFRNRSPWTNLIPEHVRRIESETDGKKFALIGGQGKWSLEGSPGEAVDANTVKDWLSSVLALRVVSYPAIDNGTKEENGLRKPVRTIRIFVQDRSSPLLLVLGNRVASGDGTAEQTDSPRWAAVGHLDGSFVPAVVNFEDAAMFEKDESFFRSASK